MATICHYFKPKDSFPDPSGSLSRTIPPSAIAQANFEVRGVAQSPATSRKNRGPYKKLDLLVSLSLLLFIQ